MKISTEYTDYTDAFGGEEANYAWVHRKDLSLPAGATLAQIKRTAKRENGLAGVRGTWTGNRVSDVLKFRPRGCDTILFVEVSE